MSAAGIAARFALGLFVLAWVLLLAKNCDAGELTREDVTSEITWQSLHAVDWYQTDMIARRPGEFHEIESAWLIGEHPSRRNVAALMVSTAALHYVVTRELSEHDAPLWVRRFWQFSSIACTAGTVRANWSIGLRP